MLTDSVINNIINGHSPQEQIDQMILSEGWYEKAKTFFTSNSWKSKLLTLGLTVGLASGVWKLYRRSSKCNAGLSNIVAFLSKEVYEAAKDHGVSVAVSLAETAALEITGSHIMAKYLSRIVRTSLKALERKVTGDATPTDEQIAQAAEAAVAAAIPEPNAGKDRLAKTRKSIETKGVIPKYGKGRIYGEEAYKIWLDRRFSEGVGSRLPICILVLMYSPDRSKGKSVGTGVTGWDQFAGVGENTLRAEFKNVLKINYPKFEY